MSDNNNNEEEQKLEGVTEVNDSDVLCGRGGAALRHAGNQTYRKLVSLNKGLYITCLKTEKLKISRSIVAAIREKKGRFLEKDTKSGTWFDIGDKKAVEKTSQALREGQPKLRQQIVEMGGGAAGAASLIESQFGPQAAAAVAGAGLYPQQGQMQGGGPRSIMTHGQQQISVGNGGMGQQMMNQQGYATIQQQQQQQQRRQMSGLPFDDIQNDLMSRLSLHDDSSGIPQQQRNMQMMSNGMGMHGGSMQEYGGYGTGQMNQMRMGNPNGMMPDSFHMAMGGMASPSASIQNSLHSTQHTLDFSSMHSLDMMSMSGLSGHSISMASGHTIGTLGTMGTMGPPSAHMPTMSSMPRQHQIDERYAQNIGLNPHAMGQSFQRQTHDPQPSLPPPQPQQPRQHVEQNMPTMPPQPPRQPSQSGQRLEQNMPELSQQRIHPGQQVRGYNGMHLPRGRNDVSDYAEGSADRYSNQRQQELHVSGGYSQESSRPASRDHATGNQERGMQGHPRYDEQRNDQHPASSTEDNPKTSGAYSASPSVPSVMSSSNPPTNQPSVLSPETRQKMVDRRSMLARMKFRKPPSVRDTKMSGMSAHSTGDGMPEIYMVESARSLHSNMSTMTDGTPKRQNQSAKDSWVETARVVDHSNKDYMDVFGSKNSLMSGLSRISDHSQNDVSIFSGLSNKIGNVSTRSIAAMSEISVIEVASEKEEEEDEPTTHNSEPTAAEKED